MHSKLTQFNKGTANKVRKIYVILVFIMVACIGCEWRLKPGDSSGSDESVAIERYDRIQSLYLTTGDFSALQQLNTVYPMQTRTLIEDVLKIGRVNDPEINTKFLRFYQDTTLQTLVNEAERQYANMDDLNESLTSAFKRLKKEIPALEIPMVYAQIGALDQSIIIGNNTIGISLDKYLGSSYPLYEKYYPVPQRAMMNRAMIVPDCMVFYILSLYPMPFEKPDIDNQFECDIHMGKIQWVVNDLVRRKVFSNKFVATVDAYMKKHKGTGYHKLLVECDTRAITEHGS